MLSKDSENSTNDWKINVIDFNNFQSNDNFLSPELAHMITYLFWDG